VGTSYTSEETVDGHVIRSLSGTRETSKSPCVTLNILAKRIDDSLIAEGWRGDKTCHTVIFIGMSVTIARPDITTTQPERGDPPCYSYNGVAGGADSGIG
jgi:hypothetical protein